MDRLMIEYLRNRGMGGMNDKEFMDKFHQFVSTYRRDSLGYKEDSFIPMENKMNSSRRRRQHKPMEYMEDFNSEDSLFDKYNRHNWDNDFYKAFNYMRDSMNDGEHFNEHEAKYLVEDMYHMEAGKKISGEKFDLNKAQEIYNRYKSILPMDTTVADLYVAINAHYHDNISLFKNWFGTNADHKIIESAIMFWFKDDDYKSGNKVAEYLKQY